MRLSLAFALPAVALVGLGGGWLAGNFATPYIVTDAMFAQFKGGGAKENRLSKAPLRTAKTAKVVADNGSSCVVLCVPTSTSKLGRRQINCVRPNSVRRVHI